MPYPVSVSHDILPSVPLLIGGYPIAGPEINVNGLVPYLIGQCCMFESIHFHLNNILSYQIICEIECYLDDYFNKAMRDECFGKADKVEDSYDKISDVYLLKRYLIDIVFQEIMNSRLCNFMKDEFSGSAAFVADADFTCPDVSDLDTSFDIDCISSHYKCLGIDVNTIINNLKYFIAMKGIGCMMISAGSTDTPTATNSTACECEEISLFKIR